MSTNVVGLRGVRKPSLVLVKGGRGKADTPPLTDEERYPRFPPAWVDWLVLGLGLAALNLPSPIPLLSIGGIVLIAWLVARRITKEGGSDPNCEDGVTIVVADLFKETQFKRPFEKQRKFPSGFDKQLVTFCMCELILYGVWRVLLGGRVEWDNTFSTILIFFIVTSLGLKMLMWWDGPISNHRKS